MAAEDIPFNELVETTAVLSAWKPTCRSPTATGGSVPAYRAWCRRVLTETVFFSSQST